MKKPGLNSKIAELLFDGKPDKYSDHKDLAEAAIERFNKKFNYNVSCEEVHPQNDRSRTEHYCEVFQPGEKAITLVQVYEKTKLSQFAQALCLRSKNLRRTNKMKNYSLLLVTVLLIQACSATAIIKDTENQDGTREVISCGNVVAGKDSVLSTAKDRAKLLCSNSYDVISDNCNDDSKISCVLRFKCK